LKLTILAVTVYAIQTPYKSAVYSIKLKLEFTILNQLMNLVKGNVTANTNSRYASSGRSASRPGIRSAGKSTKKEMGNSAGAFTRMEDPPYSPAGDTIHMHDIRDKDVLKTTTTEVMYERRKGGESMGSRGSRQDLERSSSEIQIIQHTRP